MTFIATFIDLFTLNPICIFGSIFIFLAILFIYSPIIVLIILLSVYSNVIGWYISIIFCFLIIFLDFVSITIVTF